MSRRSDFRPRSGKARGRSARRYHFDADRAARTRAQLTRPPRAECRPVRHSNVPSGDNDYVMHFDADGLPPVRSFWSATIYDADGFQVGERDQPDSRSGIVTLSSTTTTARSTSMSQHENPGSGQVHRTGFPRPEVTFRGLHAAVPPDRTGSPRERGHRRLSARVEERREASPRDPRGKSCLSAPPGRHVDNNVAEVVLGGGSMPKYGITETNIEVERLLDKRRRIPRHRYLLTAFARHRYVGDRGALRGASSVPEMTVEQPGVPLQSSSGCRRSSSTGTEALAALYRGWAETDQSIFYGENETVAVGDNMVVSRVIPLPAAAGIRTSRARYRRRQQDAMYLMKANIAMIWPYDDNGRMVGEDVLGIRRHRPRLRQTEPRRRHSPPSRPRSCSIPSSSRFRRSRARDSLATVEYPAISASEDGGVHRLVGGALYVPVRHALIVGVGLEMGTPRSGG